MKKFGRKLFLSCAALAACATTLVSTTFAWYTSNTEVSAGSLQALSSATVDSSSFYIASANTYDTNKAVATMNPYGPSADPVTVAGKTDDKLNTTFAPVYYNTSDGTYKQLTGATAAEGSTDKTVPSYAAQANVDILEFVYRFRITNPGTGVKDVPVYFKTFSVTNTVTALPTQKANTAGFTSAQTGIDTAGADYAVDILKAMKMNITITKMTSETVLSSQAADKSVNVYDLAAYSTLTDVNIAKNSETQVPMANALGFYNCIMGTALTVPTNNYKSGTALAKNKATAPLFYIPGDTGYVEVRFVFYLDGWDSYCYDVCRQQGIKVVMDFTSAVADAAETISGYAEATQWNPTPSQS